MCTTPTQTITPTGRLHCLLRPTMDWLMGPGGRRDKKESQLSLSLECWWRGHQVQKARLVCQVPQVPLAHQAVLEIPVRGAHLVVLVFLVLMVYQDPLGQS